VWPGCTRAPGRTLRLDFDIDEVSDGAVIELARDAGLLLEEERQFPELVRVRLKRSLN
jgi:hypothetical protein